MFVHVICQVWAKYGSRATCWNCRIISKLISKFYYIVQCFQSHFIQELNAKGVQSIYFAPTTWVHFPCFLHIPLGKLTETHRCKILEPTVAPPAKPALHYTAMNTTEKKNQNLDVGLSVAENKTKWSKEAECVAQGCALSTLLENCVVSQYTKKISKGMPFLFYRTVSM